MPLCPTCGATFDGSLPDLPSRVLTFAHGGRDCIDVYGRDLDDAKDPLVRLGTLEDIYYNFGSFTVGGRPEN